jgi:hypothetical protein
MSRPSNDQQAGRDEGDDRKRRATSRVARARRVWTRRIQRAFLALLMERQTGIVDDIRGRVKPPTDAGTALWGAATLGLALRGLIRRVEFTPSSRPERHGCFIGVWTLNVEHAKARHWLDTHRDLPEPEPGDDDGEDAASSPSRKPSPPSKPTRSASAQLTLPL